MKYQTLLFDADDTLFDTKKSEKIAFVNTMEYFNVSHKEKYFKIFKKINYDIWMLYEKGHIKVRDLREKIYLNFVQKAHLDIDYHLLSDKIHELMCESIILVEGAEDVLKKIKKNFSCNHYIVTNGLKRIQEERLKKSPINNYIDGIFCADQIGYQKPDIRYFEKVFQQIEPFDKHKTLIVGDNLNADIWGGKNAGIHTCWLNPAKHTKQMDVQANFQIVKLKELLVLFS